MMASGATPLPYTPVEYIETDGVSYIDTGINGNDPRSCELKYMVKTLSNQCVLGVGDGESTSLYNIVYVNANGQPGFGHRYYYTNANVTVSVESPFEVKSAMKNGSQSIGVKRATDASFQTISKTQSNTITTNKSMYLFASRNLNDDGANRLCTSGSRLYYCKIYSTNNYTTLVFDGVPCYYNGEYGLWDRVSNSFKGNANSNGAFTGPSIS